MPNIDCLIADKTALCDTDCGGFYKVMSNNLIEK